MRIPVTQADWPLAFNKIAKYIGRHWPTGTQSLNSAREITAVLFGYKSVHDTQQELLVELPEKDYSESDMIRSMTLRALTKFRLRPDQAFPIFTKAPLRELSVYALTDEAKLKEWQKLERSRGRMMVITDEWQAINNYKTPNLLINLYDLADIPPYKYAVDHTGNIFTHSYLEFLIQRLEVTQSDLQELEFTGTPREFMLQYVIPLAWRPLKDAVSRVDYRNEIEWKCPYMIEVEELSDGRFALFHEGVCAYYPASFNALQLKDTLVDIYKGKPIAIGEISNIEVARKSVYKDGNVKVENGTGVLLKDGEFIEAYGQTFIRVNPIERYEPYFKSSWVQQWIWPGIDDYESKLAPCLITSGIECDHEKIRRWISGIEEIKNTLKSTENNKTIKEIFKFLFQDQYSDIEGLKKKNHFEIYRYEGMTTEEEQEAQLEVGVKIAELTANGARVRRYHPELSAYFDNAAMGVLYEEYQSRSDCHQRDPYFLQSVFSKQLSELTGFTTAKEYSLSSALLQDLLIGKLQLNDLFDAWISGSKLLSLYDNQDKLIRNMKRYAEHMDNHDKRFISHGRIADVTRKSFNETVGESMKTFRKYNAGSQVVVSKPQTWQMFTARKKK